jgi:hypothetical protein
LESIVFDLINFKQVPNEFYRHGNDVVKEDLMKVRRLDRQGEDKKSLPSIVREYILHDRGNSLFLGNSFENLPSPV